MSLTGAKNKSHDFYFPFNKHEITECSGYIRFKKKVVINVMQNIF